MNEYALFTPPCENVEAAQIFAAVAMIGTAAITSKTVILASSFLKAQLTISMATTSATHGRHQSQTVVSTTS